MKTIVCLTTLICMHLFVPAQLKTERGPLTVQTANGLLLGMEVSGITIFRGVPYAQPPVGELRWKETQPVKNWEGTRKADHFSARAMQLPIYSDMNFRSDGVSEDCLYLNIWTPAKTGKEELPVLVYIYGGGFNAGDGSEFRYDGENMARRGIVSITVNYRLGVFGFLAHPDLTKESGHHASGNYALLDQTEALRWIHKNIAAFGGNPDNITIAGESAGSSSVNALVVSPLPRNLFAGAIAESGSVMGYRDLVPLADAEKNGLRFSNSLGTNAIKDLRAMPAEKILQAAANLNMHYYDLDVDGYFMPELPATLYATGKVSKVPLLIGWNSEEGSWKNILGNAELTKENYISAVNRLYPKNAEEILKLYPVLGDADVDTVATALATDRSNAFGDWRWLTMHAKINAPVYRYYYTKPRPALMADFNKKQDINSGDLKTPGNEINFRGAAHSAEIEYAMGNLPANRVYNWQADDYLVSAILQGYFLNFIKTKNPNGVGLPYWPLYTDWQKDPIQYIGVETYRAPDKTKNRYLYFEKIKSN